MEYYQEQIAREKNRAETKSTSRLGQPGSGHHGNKTSRTRAGPSETIRQSIAVDSSTTKNDYNQVGPNNARKRKATSQPPPSKRRKRNPDKSYNPENDHDDEDENGINKGKRTKPHPTATPPLSRKRGSSEYKDFEEKNSDDEDDNKKGRKRLKSSSPIPPPKRQKKDYDDDDESGPPAKNTRASCKIRKALLSAKSSNENSEKSKPKPKATAKSKGKGKTKNASQGILPLPISNVLSLNFCFLAFLNAAPMSIGTPRCYERYTVL